MKLFLSWSGSLSREVAESIKAWLELSFRYIDTFMSSEDIDRGSRWSVEISEQLEATDFGILCITRDNLHAPWIMFEAGALAKRLRGSRVVPLLVDLSVPEFTDAGGPLTQFNALALDQQSLMRLATELNALAPQGQKLGDGKLEKLLARDSEDIEGIVRRVEQTIGEQESHERKPKPEVKVGTVLDVVERQHRLLSDPRKILPEDYVREIFRSIKIPSRPVDDTYFNRTTNHNNLIYKLRDACVKSMSNGVKYVPPRVKKKEVARPHVVLEENGVEISALLGDMARMFSLLAPEDTRVWTALRDLRGDDKFHTYARGGEYSPARVVSSNPLVVGDSKVLARLLDGSKQGQHINITGSTAGPQEWEPQANDTFGEDKSVMMGVVWFHTYIKKRNEWKSLEGPWVLSVSANREDAFNEKHIPLMQCCVESFSLLLNVLLRGHMVAEQHSQ